MQPLDLARQLGQVLAKSPEYLALQQARAMLEQHGTAKEMLEDFRKKEWELEQKKALGDPLIEAYEQELGKLAEIIGLNPYIREYVMAEIQFSQIMLEIQDIIAAAVEAPPLGDPDFEA